MKKKSNFTNGWAEWRIFWFCLCLQVVGESLLYMLQCSLGQAYTAPLRQAWLNMYSIVVAAMSRGWAKNGEDKADWGAQRELLSSCCQITQHGCYGIRLCNMQHCGFGCCTFALWVGSHSVAIVRCGYTFTIGSTNHRVYFLCCGYFSYQMTLWGSEPLWSGLSEFGSVIWAPHTEKKENCFVSLYIMALIYMYIYAYTYIYTQTIPVTVVVFVMYLKRVAQLWHNRYYI